MPTPPPGAPNFRPRFTYFTWHTALTGAVLCGVILFLSGPVYASVSVCVLIGVFGYVHWRAPVKEWGDVTQALIYHQVRAASHSSSVGPVLLTILYLEGTKVFAALG